MMSSSDFSAVAALWYWVSRPATWPIGAIAREASMVQAISPPSVSWASAIRYTPITTTITLTNCCAHIAPLMVDDDSSRNCAPTRDRKVALDSHLRCMTPSAPSALIVSSPTRLSTRVALRMAPAR